MIETRKLRPVPQVEIRIPALPRATKEVIADLCDKFKWFKADESPEEEVVLTFATVLFEGEWYIPKGEYLERLPSVKRPLGISQALWLSENFHKLSEEVKNVVKCAFLDFPATRFIDIDDEDAVLYLYFNGSDLLPSVDRLAHSFKNLADSQSNVADYIAIAKEV